MEGRGKENLLLFFKKYAGTTDIFCLQEVWEAPYEHLEGYPAGGLEIENQSIMVYGLQEISGVLSNHRVFFRPHYGDHYGLTLFVRNTLKMIEEGESFVHKHKGYVPTMDVGLHARNIQYVTIATDTGPITVINFHGLWTNEGEGTGKKDNKDRLEQSRKIIEFITNNKHPFVLCGDFNLLPETKSIQMFEDAGFRNLIKEFDIQSTRTSFYTKPSKFADYAFLSTDLSLKNFKILPDEVSDHAPLFIEID